MDGHTLLKFCYKHEYKKVCNTAYYKEPRYFRRGGIVVEIPGDQMFNYFDKFAVRFVKVFLPMLSNFLAVPRGIYGVF